MATAQWQQQSTAKQANKTSLQSTQNTATFIYINTEFPLVVINFGTGGEEGYGICEGFVISGKWDHGRGRKWLLFMKLIKWSIKHSVVRIDAPSNQQSFD